MQLISIIVGEPIIRERLVYVLDFLENHPLCPEGVKFEICEESSGGEMETFYGGEKNENNFFVPIREVSFLKNDLQISDGLTISDLRLAIGENPSATMSGQNLGTITFDIFETIFFHISRYEEFFCKKNKLDAHGRMKAEEMVLIKNGLEKTPIIDRLVFDFFENLGLKPETQQTEMHISHDIDMLLKFPSRKKVVKAFASMILKQRSWTGLVKLTRQYFRCQAMTFGHFLTSFLEKKRKSQAMTESHYLTGIDPFDTYDWLFTDKKFKTKTVYILPEGTVPRIEKHFKLDDPKVRAIIDLAKSRGYEIGLHPSYNAGFDESLFLNEKEKLEKVVGEQLTQTRQHFLRWDWSKTPQLIEKARLKTDSTLGFSDRIGFRCGTGFPYKLYDFENERAFDFLEIPMVVMDVSLLRESENPQKLLTDFLNKNQTNTAITFNFHNSSFDEVYLDAQALKNLYCDFFV